MFPQNFCWFGYVSANGAVFLICFHRQSGSVIIFSTVSAHVETVCLLSNTQKEESYVTLDVEMKDDHHIMGDRKSSDKPASE